MNTSKKRPYIYAAAIVILVIAGILYFVTKPRSSGADDRVPVGNSGLTRYSDPELGLSFLYPLAWPAPQKIRGTDDNIALIFPGKSLKIIVGSYRDKTGRALSVPEVIQGVLEWGTSFGRSPSGNAYQDIQRTDRMVDGRPATELSFVDIYPFDRILIPLGEGDNRFIDIVDTEADTPASIDQAYVAATSTVDALVDSMQISAHESPSSAAYAGSPRDGLSDAALANGTYDISSWLYSEGAPIITLHDGIWQGSGSLGSCIQDRLAARIAEDPRGKPEILHGDLNGDGAPDAVVFLSVSDDSSLNACYSGIDLQSWERQFGADTVMQIVMNRNGQPDIVYSGLSGNVVSSSIQDGVITNDLAGLWTTEPNTERLKLVREALVTLSTSTLQAEDTAAEWPGFSVDAYGISGKYPPGFSITTEPVERYDDPLDQEPVFAVHPDDPFYEASSTVSDAAIRIDATTTPLRQLMKIEGYGQQTVPKEVRIGGKTAYELPFKGDAAMGTYFNESSYIVPGSGTMLYQFTMSYVSHRIDRENMSEDQASGMAALDAQKGSQLRRWLIDVIDSAVISDPAAAAAPGAGSGSVHITSPTGGARWDLGTLGTWQWSVAGTVSAVDIYIDMASTTYALARAYPNTGHFSWTVGAAYAEWNMASVPDGDYRISVCPSGIVEGSPSCDSFVATVQGTMPALSLLAPLGGETYKPGQSIAVTFTDPQNGDAYDVYLDKPAKGSDIMIKLGSIRATVPGDPNEDTHAKTQAISFVVPQGVSSGTDWSILIIQTSNHGQPCVNACDTVNSQEFTVSQ